MVSKRTRKRTRYGFGSAGCVRAGFFGSECFHSGFLSSGFLTWFLFAVASSACSPSSGHVLAVELRTDLVAEEEFDQLRLTLFPLGDDGRSTRETFSAQPGGYLPAARVGDLEGITPGNYRLEMSVSNSSNGRIVTERPVLVQVESNLSVTVPITRSCVEVACPPRDDPEKIACLGGQCVDPRCSVEAPQFCGDALCTNDADCAIESSCAQGECVLGVCWAVSTGETCPDPAEWCHPERGCSMRTVLEDGGMSIVDGGTMMDASVGDGGMTVDGGMAEWTPTNFPEHLLLAGTGPLEIAGAMMLDTDTGEVLNASMTPVATPGVVFSPIQQSVTPGVKELGVFSARSFSILGGGSLRVRGSRALVIATSGDIIVDGVIDASGGLPSQWSPGPGGYRGGRPGQPAEGPGATPGAGAGAGHVHAGGASPGSPGGPIAGSPALNPLAGGSGGSFGSANDDSLSGGGGGGAVQLSALGRVRVTAIGGINVGGAGGGGLSGVMGRCSGGGAGGSVLIEGSDVEILGTVAANGGGGGGNAFFEPAVGQSGQLSGTPAVGGMGLVVNGGNGGAGATAPTDGTREIDSIGGGGGSGGRVRVRSVNPPALSGTISPTAGLQVDTIP